MSGQSSSSSSSSTSWPPEGAAPADCPNPELFARLRRAMEEEADERVRRRLGRCLRSLSRYPLPLEPGQCLILEGFNAKVVRLVEGVGGEAPPLGREPPPEAVAFPVSPIPKRFRCLGDDVTDDGPGGVVEKSQEELDHEFAVRLSQEINGGGDRSTDDLGQEEHEVVELEDGCDEAGEALSRKAQEERDAELARRLQMEERRERLSETYTALSSLNRKASEGFLPPDEDDGDDDSFMRDLFTAPSPTARGAAESTSPICITPPPAPRAMSSSQAASVETENEVNSDGSEEHFPSCVNLRTKQQSSLATNSTASDRLTKAATCSRKVHDMSLSEEESDEENQNPVAEKRSVEIPGPSAVPEPIQGRCKAKNGPSQGPKQARARKTKEDREAAALARKSKKNEENGVTFLSELPSWASLTMSREESRSMSETASVDRHRPEFHLEPGTFDVLLLVDSAETAGGEQGGKQNRKGITTHELQAKQVNFEVRKLNVGDFAWVARESRPRPGCRPRELVLPHVVERKRVDDLLHSIRDSRYKEQKWRLARCGVPNAIYLVEQFSRYNAEKYGANLESIDTVLITTASTRGFSVKVTHNQRDSISYLASMTSLLEEEYKWLRLTSCCTDDIDKGLVKQFKTTLITFKDFYDSTKKSPTLSASDIFLRMLMQLSGVSFPVAEAIAKVYPTLGHLVKAYREECSSDGERDKMLAGLTYEGGRKKIGSSVSTVIAALYDTEAHDIL